MTELTDGLLRFLDASPSAFHAVENIKAILRREGYEELFEENAWHIVPGKKYFTTRNHSSLIAFQIGEDPEPYHFQLVASHSDSPTFRLKAESAISDEHYLKLNTEGYGGMIVDSWFDRPLSLAGRALIKEDGALKTRLVNIDRNLLMIPSVAIHLQRDSEKAAPLNKQIDLLPLLGGEGTAKDTLTTLLAETLDVEPAAIYGTDLQLYNRMPARVWGAHDEFFSSGRLDNLLSAYTTLAGFLNGDAANNINVYLCFDNEEVGSGTKQGALSTFASDTLRRVIFALGGSEEDYLRALANGFLISADNAHAVHPNHPELMDPTNRAYLNQGIVVKSHAEQRYTSDAQSIALFKWICELANVPVQFFSNRSDKRGGSTLGNLLMRQASLNTVDVGLPQLAMHSAYETAGVCDPEFMVQAITTYFTHTIERENGDTYRLR